jgi:hypothetical protein
MKVEFKNVDGSLLQASIKFFPFKQFILNSLLMVVSELNVECCKIRIDAERDVIGMVVFLFNKNLPSFCRTWLKQLMFGTSLKFAICRN